MLRGNKREEARPRCFLVKTKCFWNRVSLLKVTYTLRMWESGTTVSFEQNKIQKDYVRITQLFDERKQCTVDKLCVGFSEQGLSQHDVPRSVEDPFNTSWSPWWPVLHWLQSCPLQIRRWWEALALCSLVWTGHHEISELYWNYIGITVCPSGSTGKYWKSCWCWSDLRILLETDSINGTSSGALGYFFRFCEVHRPSERCLVAQTVHQKRGPGRGSDLRLLDQLLGVCRFVFFLQGFFVVFFWGTNTNRSTLFCWTFEVSQVSDPDRNLWKLCLAAHFSWNRFVLQLRWPFALRPVCWACFAAANSLERWSSFKGGCSCSFCRPLVLGCTIPSRNLQPLGSKQWRWCPAKRVALRKKTVDGLMFFFSKEQIY